MLLLLDITAAFDIVDQEILLHRLETTFSFRGVILQWLGSYLEGTTQSVMLTSQSTIDRTVVCGVPHGSVLGPLLFTLYTVDIGKVIQQCGLSHHSYADDNQLYASCIPSESAALNPLTDVSRGSGYNFFVTLYGEPAVRIEHYMQKRAVSRRPG